MLEICFLLESECKVTAFLLFRQTNRQVFLEKVVCKENSPRPAILLVHLCAITKDLAGGDLNAAAF